VCMSDTFQRFLNEHQIQHEPTSGYTPEENGHAEKSVDIIKVRVQSMLSDSGLKGYMWGECMPHATVLQNFTSATGGKSPWELLKGKSQMHPCFESGAAKHGSSFLVICAPRLITLVRARKFDLWASIGPVAKRTVCSREGLQLTLQGILPLMRRLHQLVIPVQILLHICRLRFIFLSPWCHHQHVPLLQLLLH
jgi:hypothetical protein